MQDVLSTISTLHDLKGLGVQLALDDFGSGSTSLSQLRRFPLDTLKIDRIFVDGLGRDSEDATIVGAMLSLAQALGLSAVAEGVETAGQLRVLDRLGCDLVQGFLMARPMPPESVPGLLTSTPWTVGAAR